MKKTGRLKKFVLAVLSAVMALTCFGGLAACGTDSSKIQIWAGTYWGGDNQPILQSMVDKWNEYARANDKPEAVLSVKQDMRGNMTTGAISGRIGDVIIWDRWESLRLANQEIFVPIDSRLKAAGHEVDEFNAAAMSETRYNGKHYGVPFDLDTWGLFVNRNMYLDWAKSVTDPATLAWLVSNGESDEVTVGDGDVQYNYPKDWDQFHTAALGCTKRDGNGKITTAGLTVDAEFVAWIATSGGAIANINEQGKGSVVLHTDEKIPGDSLDRTYKEATTSVLDFLDKLIEQDTDTAEEKAQAVTSFTFFSNSGMVDYFLNKTVAFKTNSILNGMTTYNKYKTADFEFDFIPFPSMPGINKRGGMLGGYSMSIPQRAPHVGEAWEMIEWWILNDENYKMWTELSGLVPARKSVMNAVRQNTELTSSKSYLKVAIDNIDNYMVRPPHIAYSTYETNVQTSKLDAYLRRQLLSSNSVRNQRNEFFRLIKENEDLDGFLGIG